MNVPLTIAMTCLPLGQIDAEATFQRWDANGDGWLSPAELPDRLQPNFTRVDTNQDGRISRQEHVRFLSPRKRSQPTDDHSRLRVLRNLAYVPNGHERHRLDVYLPPADGRRKPLVVWIHGGGWKAGSKNGCPAISLTERGFVVASVNYRLSQHAPFPAQIHDCKAAIRWLRDNTEAFEIDPDRVGVWGSSAGGHLAALVGTSADVATLEGELGTTTPPSRVQAVCDWFGPTDFLQMNAQAGTRGRINHDAADSPESLLLGAPLPTVPDKARQASPITWVSADDPPFLIQHGDQDRLVAWQQSQLLHDALVRNGVASRFERVPDAGHGLRDAAIRETVFDFFESRLGTISDAATAAENP